MIIETNLTIDQVVTMVHIGKGLHEESEFSDVAFDARRAVSVFSQINVPGSGVIGAIALEDGEIHGYIVGRVEPHFFSSDLAAYDMMVYVPKEKRGAFTVVRLIKKFEELAKEHGCSRVYLGISTNIHPERTGALYNRLGYVNTGANTVKRI
ncbi:GNAT family N-acetyltransferase [bacterium]|nr:GNAT family N-acetyltransferase [bacterium]